MTAGETRLITLDTLGTSIILFVVCRVNPLLLLSPNNIRLLAAYLMGILMILFSGFRTGITNAFIITVLATVLRDRFEGFVKIIFLTLLVGLFFVMFSYSGVELPFTFQRAFSFLPGHWSQEAVRDAKTSSDWRFEMWRVILSSDKYIRSKIWGDGFGFLRSDYETMMDSAAGIGRGFEGENKDQEAFMISGDFHNGPLSTVRFVGYFGLALFLPLLFMMAIYAYRFIRLAEGTPFQFCAYFIGIPILSIPIGFLLVFGDYRTNLVELLFNVGLIKMLTSSLRDYINQKNESEGFHVAALPVN